MNKNSLITAVALGLVSLTAQAAGTATNSFNVTVGLTAKCQLKGSPTDMAFTYTAFGGAATASTSVAFECTRGLGAAPTVSLDTGTDKSAGTAGATTTGAGVVGGLQYTLSVAGGSLTAGSAASTTSTGTADQYSYSISGNMPAGQAGDVTAATSQTRTLTVSY